MALSITTNSFESIRHPTENVTKTSQQTFPAAEKTRLIAGTIALPVCTTITFITH
jgi:hypothetical protein